jgi:hypothetical protein
MERGLEYKTHTHTMSTVDFFNSACRIAKPQTVRGRVIPRQVCGVGSYYYPNLPQIKREDLDAFLFKDREPIPYKSAMIQIYHGGDNIGWHKDIRPSGYVDDKVTMFNYGFNNRVMTGLEEVTDKVLGYIEFENKGKIELRHGQMISENAYDEKHRAYTYKSSSKGRWLKKGCDYRMNITLRN